MERPYTSQPVRLRLSVSGRRALWALRWQQDQAFNMGVELALTQEPGERVPTPFTAWKRLTAWRADGTLPRHGVALQRAGVDWTGAVQIVDITDRKGRLTRRTRPGHRTYMARAILRAPAPQAVEPERIDEVLGVDVGVTVTAYGSNGSQHHMPGEAEAPAATKVAQRRRASCRHDSRRHDKRGRRLATMQRRRANRRRNARRHIAKAVVTTPGIRAVAVEDLNLRNMLRSAKGTTEQPGTRRPV